MPLFFFFHPVLISTPSFPYILETWPFFLSLTHSAMSIYLLVLWLWLRFLGADNSPPSALTFLHTAKAWPSLLTALFLTPTWNWSAIDKCNQRGVVLAPAKPTLHAVWKPHLYVCWHLRTHATAACVELQTTNKPQWRQSGKWNALLAYLCVLRLATSTALGIVHVTFVPLQPL